MILTLMHIVHLLTVILWIGGLGFITILMLPLIIRMEDPLQKVLLLGSGGFESLGGYPPQTNRPFSMLKSNIDYTIEILPGKQKTTVYVFLKVGLNI